MNLKIPETAPLDESGLLAGSWIWSISLGVAFMQLLIYSKNRSKDALLLQGTILFLFCCEMTWSVLALVATYNQLLESAPDSLKALGISMPLPLLVACYFGDITLLGVNLVFIWRYCRLSKRSWIGIPLAVLAVGSLCTSAVGNFYGVRCVLETSKPAIDIIYLFKILDRMRKLIKAASILEFSVVAATYGLLVAELGKWLREDLLGGKTVVKRLLIITVESGIVTLALTATLVARGWMKPVPVTMTAVKLSCARAYYHTLLFNLNIRSSGGLMMNDGEPTLSHISSAIRTKHTVSTGNTAVDLEISAIKLESPFAQPSNEEGGNVKHKFEGQYAKGDNLSRETVS